MQQTSIRKKLYQGFGTILGILTLIFVISIFTMVRESSARSETSRSIVVSQSAEQIRYQMIHNRLSLSNYLLSGDSRESDALREGMSKLMDSLRLAESNSDDRQKAALNTLQAMETDWDTNFSQKMVEKRKQVDSGNATVADLQIAYLQLEPAKWMNKANVVIDQVELETSNQLKDRRESDGRWAIVSAIVTISGFLLAIAL
jgi:methyl-accepting chemotaxis protein WspA